MASDFRTDPVREPDGQCMSCRNTPTRFSRSGRIRRILGVSVLLACSSSTGADRESLEPPADLGDGWTVASPASMGIDEQAIEALASRIEAEEFGHVHALVVVRHGQLAYERYFHEYDGMEPHTLQSVTKSVTSALVGIALERGDIASLDLTLGELFPDYADIFAASPAKAGIRIRDLLSMRAGMAWDESTWPISDDRNDVGRLNRSADWVRSALEQPMSATPGSTWTYSSGAVILLSRILLTETGMDAIAYARENLFGPLGITNFVWYRNPVDGLPHTGGGLRLVPRDLARFGQLYLDAGVWDGQRILTEAWVHDSGRVLSTVGENGYGYLWWLRSLRGVLGHSPARSDVLFGWGYGGQHVFVSADLDLVVVVNGWNPNGGTSGPQLFDELVRVIDRP